VRAGLLIALLLAGPAAADDDAAALGLADKTVTQAERARDLHLFGEAAWSGAPLRSGGPTQQLERLSVGVLYDASFASQWRAVFDDRLDARWQQEPSDRARVNTLQDAYLSWQIQPDRIADLGRINTRYGVAYGFNPTDYFRTHAVRSIVSTDPASQRENRLGSVMARGQALWSGGSLTAAYSPKLADHRATGAFDLDFGATNNQDRWLVVMSQRISEQLTPQLLVLGAAGDAPQVGLNLTTLVNDATVFNFEWSGGRSTSLLAQALALPRDTAFRSRLASNLTYTTPSKLSLTLEYEYDGAAVSDDAWNHLGRTSPAAYGAYRGYVADVQDPPTRRRVFVRIFWQDAAINHLDLTSNIFVDAVDHSRQVWIEARYHWTRVDVAAQWQRNDGSFLSQYGALAERHITQLLVRYFL